MNDKIKKELEKTNYSGLRFNVLLGWVVAILAITFFFFIIPPFPKDPPSPKVTKQPAPAPQQTNRSRNVVSSEWVRVGPNEWSKTFRVFAGQCFSASATNPDQPSYRLQGRPLKDGSDWFEITETISTPTAWFRLLSKGPGYTDVLVEIKKNDAC